MSYEPVFNPPNRIIEMYPYTPPDEPITGPLIGYRLTGFDAEWPEFTYGRHDYVEDNLPEGGALPNVYRGSYLVKPVDNFWGFDIVKEFRNTVKNYRSRAVVGPLTKEYISRYMMPSVYWVSMGFMDYVATSGSFRLPVYDHTDTRTELLDTLVELGFNRDDIIFTSAAFTPIEFTVVYQSISPPPYPET